MGAGSIAGIFLILMLLVATPYMVGFFMKAIWKIRGREDLLKAKAPYYKDPYWFALILTLAIVVVCIFSFLLFAFGVKLLFSS